MMDVEKLRGLLERATPGPWRWEDRPKHGKAQVTYHTDVGGIVAGDAHMVAWFGDSETYYPTDGTPPNEHDLALLLEAVNALPDLLDALTRQQQRVERLEGALRPFADHLYPGRDWGDDVGGPETMASAGMVRAARAALSGETSHG
jgi:hypothetical protein